MKAIVWTRYGPPEGLELREVEKPVPKDNEILVKIRATTVTAGDCEMRSLKIALGLGYIIRLFNGIGRPKRTTILGQELSGVVEAVGNDVTKFKPGDEVFGATDFSMGAYAEYKCFPEEGEAVVALKPTNLSFEEAATIPMGGFTALYFLRRANIQEGHKVLINGAGGSIGTIGVQLAKHWGAEVTAVDSAGKLEMLRSIGADHVIDYKQEDFIKSGETYDVIFDVVGKASYSGSVRTLKENGIHLIGNPTVARMVRSQWTSRRSSKKVITGAASNNIEDLEFLKGLIEAGKIKAVIDRRYPLEQMVEAHKYVETGQKVGNVVITVDHDNNT